MSGGKGTVTSADERGNWFGIWLWLSVILLIACLIFGVILFYRYHQFFPNISPQRDDWNVFGALIGGFGSCLGAIATIATLLFLAHQNAKQQVFIDWQKKTQGFDWYIKHRQLFIERLRELQAMFSDQFRFRNPEKLYEGVFKDNYLAMADFPADRQRSALAGRLLEKLGVKLLNLDILLQKNSWDDRDLKILLVELIDVSYLMELDWTGDECDGDILWNGRNSGVNLYSIIETIARLHTVYDALSYYAGRPGYNGFLNTPSGRLKDALIEFKRSYRWGGMFDIANVLPYMHILDLIMRHATDIKDCSNARLMPLTYLAINKAFKSRSSVINLSDSSASTEIYELGSYEVEQALSEANIDEETRESLEWCRETLNHLQMALIYRNASSPESR